MRRGDKSSYADKQKRMAEYIERGYGTRSGADDEAERRAWRLASERSRFANKAAAAHNRQVA